MADPVVSITGGVPTSGTGTISTLGQVVAPQGANLTTGESGSAGPIRGPMVQASTVSSAPTYTAGTVNPLVQDTSGNMWVRESTSSQLSTATGSTADAAYTSGSGSIVSVLKGIFGGVTGAIPTGANTIGAVNHPATSATSFNFTSATSINTVWLFYQTTASTSASTLTGVIVQGTTLTAGAFTFEESFDQGNTWVTIPAARLLNPATGAQLSNPYTLVASTNQPFQVVNSGASQIRARLSTVITGTGTVSFNYTVTLLVGPTTVVGTGTFPVQAAQTGTWNVGVTGTANVNVTNASIPVTGTFWQATQPISGTVTVNQGTAGAAWPVTLTSTTITGTVAATQSGNWTSRIVGNGGAVIDGVIGNATAPANMIATGGVFNSTKPTLTTGQSAAFQVNSSGIQLVDGSSVTQPVATSAITPSQQTALASWTSATAVNTTVALGSGTTNVYPVIIGQITQGTTITAGAITFEESYDGGTTWFAIPAFTRVLVPSTNNALNNPYALVASTNQPFQILTNGTLQVRARLSTAITGTGTVTIALTNAQVASIMQVFQPVAANLNMMASGQASTSAPTYTNASGNPLSLNLSGGLRVDGSGVTQPVSLTSTTITGTVGVTQSTTPWTVGGDVASGTADSGNPLKVGGVARTADPTAVTAGQRVNGYFDKVGKLIAVNSVRSLRSSVYSTLTTTTETSIVGATLSIYNDIYALIISNTSASIAIIDFRTTTGGPIVMTMVIPANDTRGMTLTADSGFPQTSVNTNWTAQLRSAVSSIYITALFVQNT